MKDILKLGFALMLYGVIAAFALAMVNSATKPVIEELAKAEKETAIKEVLPAQELDPDTLTVDGADFEYITGYDASKNLVGYVVISYGTGFSSTIQTIIGLNPDFTINAIEIVSQNETPGLGTKCVEIKGDAKEPWFETQFDGKKPGELAVKKDGGDLDAIAGATITSRAVANSVKEYASKLEANMPAQAPAEGDSLAVNDSLNVETTLNEEVTNE